jgi:hypothetical protein
VDSAIFLAHHDTNLKIRGWNKNLLAAMVPHGHFSILHKYKIEIFFSLFTQINREKY